MKLLHDVFIKFPVGVFWLFVLAVYLGVIRWHNKFGVYAEKLDDKIIFTPCSTKAMIVLDRYCKGVKGMIRLPFNSYLVPQEKYWDVYEAVMHDPKDPQCISMPVKIGRHSFTIIDT